MSYITQLTVFCLVLAAAYQTTSQRSSQPSRPVQAMTLILRETAAHANEQPVEVDKLFAVDRHGSRTNVTLPTSKFKTGQEARNVYLTLERKYVVVADAIRAVSTFPLTQLTAEAAQFVAVSQKCEEAGAKPAGETKILGYTVFGYTEERATQRRSRSTSWRSPQLDCRELRYLEEQLDADGRVAHVFERVAAKVTLGDPDPALFEIPAGYREIPPSQANLELMERRAGKKIEGATLERMKPGMLKMDEHYHEGRQVK